MNDPTKVTGLTFFPGIGFHRVYRNALFVSTTYIRPKRVGNDFVSKVGRTPVYSRVGSSRLESDVVN